MLQWGVVKLECIAWHWLERTLNVLKNVNRR